MTRLIMWTKNTGDCGELWLRRILWQRYGSKSGSPLAPLATFHKRAFTERLLQLLKTAVKEGFGANVKRSNVRHLVASCKSGAYFTQFKFFERGPSGFYANLKCNFDVICDQQQLSWKMKLQMENVTVNGTLTGSMKNKCGSRPSSLTTRAFCRWGLTVGKRPLLNIWAPPHKQKLVRLWGLFKKEGYGIESRSLCHLTKKWSCTSGVGPPPPCSFSMTALHSFRTRTPCQVLSTCHEGGYQGYQVNDRRSRGGGPPRTINKRPKK